MPALTVDDLTVLPRVAGPPSHRRRRPVRSITTAPKGFEGEGFPVRRAFADIDMTELDPFVHLDQIGEIEYAPGEPKGTPWHPHRGFETVTYMMDGVIQHADSTGGGGVIQDGGTQWMTAGDGILHIETPPEAVVESGGWFHGLQLWVNLPAAQKRVPPRYQDLTGDRVTVLTTPDAGGLIRLIAGNLDGHAGPGATHTPMTMVHASVSPGAQMELSWPEEFNALAYVLGGRGFVGTDRHPVEIGQLAVFGGGDVVTVAAADLQDSRTDVLEVLILGGRPIREPVAWHGPFVMNTQAELQEAFDDFRRGRLGTVPAQHPLAPTDDVVEQTDSSLD